MKYSYELIMNCVQALGVEHTFTSASLEILLGYSDLDEHALYSLISILPNPFTDEAIEFMESE